jgi:hypothetical protein
MNIFALALVSALIGGAPAPVSMTVSNVDSTIIYTVDEQGNEWGFYGTGYEIGEKVTCLMVNDAIVGTLEG